MHQSLKLQKTLGNAIYIATVHIRITTYLQEEEKNTIHLNQITSNLEKIYKKQTHQVQGVNRKKAHLFS